MRARSCLVAVVLLVVAGCATDAAEPQEASPEPSASSPGASDGPAYVALGDSYTAGAGIPEIVDDGCFRSSANYPALVADELGLALTDVSCGGAATTSLIGVQETSDGPRPAQFSALSPDTEVVTIGIGGNDEGLFARLGACLIVRDSDPDGSPCRDSMNADGTDKIRETIALVQGRVTSALLGIRDRLPDAQILLVGYPQLVPARGGCDTLPLTPQDADYVRGLMEALGAATEQAAADAGVGYVDVLAASKGHDVCAGEQAWVNGLGSPQDQAAGLHPFAEEHAAVADLVVAALER